MEFNAEVLRFIFIVIFIVGVLALFRVKYLLKREYPEQHDEIFGGSLFEYSANRSINIIRFSLYKKKWGFVKDKRILSWLGFYRVISLIFYSIIMLFVIYMLLMVLIDLMKGWF